jgi:hypothetical protein
LGIAGVLGTAAAVWISYQTNALDAHAYWAARAPNLYDALPGTPLAFLYSPAFAQAIAPLQWLPEQVFVFGWLVGIAVAMAWLAGPRLLPFALLLAYSDLQSANVHTFLAVAILVGFRYPAAWAGVVLTKVTPGIGLVWFLRRREWRSLAIALLATAVIAAISFVADQRSWFDWIALLQRSAAAPAINLSALTPLWLRILVAALIAWWGAGRDAKWTVPVAAMVALPVIWPASLAVLLAIVPLLKDQARWRPSWRLALA